MSALGLLLALAPAAAPRDARIAVLFAPTGEKRALEERLAVEIRAARREVLVAVFHFTSDRLLRALTERRRAGLRVELLLDASQADNDLLERLRAARIDARRVTPRHEGARFHHKFCVLDGEVAITGSYNWTVLGDVANHENLLLLRDGEAARAYRDEFERIWKDTDLSRP